MMHVKQITERMDQGHLDEAEQAIEDLLFMGPNNTSAMKLKAKILESKGHFDEESMVWQKIYDIDPTDLDALNYIQRRMMEDQEARLFCHETADGGHSFFVYPKEMIRANIYAFLGCCFFLFFSLYIQSITPENQKLAIRIELYGLAFLISVIAPWFLVIRAFLGSLRKIRIDSKGITFFRLLRSIEFKWEDVESLCLKRTFEETGSKLSLSILDKKDKNLEIDLTPKSTILRARPHFIALVRLHFPDLDSESNDNKSIDHESSDSKSENTDLKTKQTSSNSYSF